MWRRRRRRRRRQKPEMAQNSRRLSESVRPPGGIGRRRRRFGRRRRFRRRRRLFRRHLMPGHIFMPIDAFDGRCRRRLRRTNVAFALKDFDDAAVRQNILVAQGISIERVMTEEIKKSDFKRDFTTQFCRPVYLSVCRFVGLSVC